MSATKIRAADQAAYHRGAARMAARRGYQELARNHLIEAAELVGEEFEREIMKVARRLRAEGVRFKGDA